MGWPPVEIKTFFADNITSLTLQLPSSSNLANPLNTSTFDYRNTNFVYKKIPN